MENNEIWKEQLTNGNLFIKHHKYTDPKLRHIWLTNDLEKINWGEPADSSSPQTIKNKKEKGSIIVKEITSIIPGLHTAKPLDKKNTELRMPCIFSIITAKRSLELEAPTEKLRNDWIEYLKELIKTTNEKK